MKLSSTVPMVTAPEQLHLHRRLAHDGADREPMSQRGQASRSTTIVARRAPPPCCIRDRTPARSPPLVMKSSTQRHSSSRKSRYASRVARTSVEQLSRPGSRPPSRLSPRVAPEDRAAARPADAASIERASSAVARRGDVHQLQRVGGHAGQLDSRLPAGDRSGRRAGSGARRSWGSRPGARGPPA